MKYTEDRDEYIFRMWYKENKTYEEIADMEIPCQLSKKRIRNIIYSGPARLKSDFERKVYKKFRIKFLEYKDVVKTINYVYNNQPTAKLSKRTIRRIINKMLKKRNKLPFTNHHSLNT